MATCKRLKSDPPSRSHQFDVRNIAEMSEKSARHSGIGERNSGAGEGARRGSVHPEIEDVAALFNERKSPNANENLRHTWQQRQSDRIVSC